MMETISVLATLFCVILLIKSSIWGWLIGIMGTIVNLMLFYGQHMYAEAIFQIVFIIQSFFGWYYWHKNKTKKYFFLNDKRFTYDMMVLCLLVIFLTHILATKTDNPQPAYDVVTGMLTIFGMWYLAKKNIYGWVVLLICNFFYIVMYVQHNVFWLAGLHAVLCVLCFNGLVKWCKNT